MRFEIAKYNDLDRLDVWWKITKREYFRVIRRCTDYL